MRKKKLSVMLIDDDLLFGEVIKNYIESFSEWEIRFVHNTNTDVALKQLMKMEFDLILLDYYLLNETGVEFINKLKLLGYTRPIILLTGAGNEDIAVEAMKAGAIDYISKTSITREVLRCSITYAIEQYNMLLKKEKKMAFEHYLANYDPLTALPNRNFFYSRLSGAMKIADSENSLLAVLFIDLDKFKDANDKYGHEAGDQLLIAVSKRLSGCVREIDTVARLGGDEFAILLEQITKPDDAAVIAAKICNKIAVPYRFDNIKITITTSIGISLYPNKVSDYKELLKNADIAMYHAKKEGENRYSFHSEDIM